jgi:hypothetical protein
LTYLELQNSTAYYLDDLEFGYFTKAQVKRWLNNAQREAQKLLLLSNENRYVKCVNTDIISNQCDYLLPADFLKLHRLAVVTDSAQNTNYFVTPITINQQDLIISKEGAPAYYYLKKNRISLLPKPNVSNYKLKLFYSYKVTDMVNDVDVPDIPEEYQEYLAILAAYDGLIKDNRSADSLLAKKNFYESLMKQDLQDRQLDQSKEIVVTSVDDLGVYY